MVCPLSQSAARQIVPYELPDRSNSGAGDKDRWDGDGARDKTSHATWRSLITWVFLDFLGRALAWNIACQRGLRR